MNARVGDCIHRTQLGFKDVFEVSTATCGTSYATNRVIDRTDDITTCPKDEWVRSTVYSVVLCLGPP